MRPMSPLDLRDSRDGTRLTSPLHLRNSCDESSQVYHCVIHPRNVIPQRSMGGQRQVPLVCPVPRRDTSHAMRSLGLNQPGWQETPGEVMMKGYEYENSPGGESSQYNRHNSVTAGDTANRSSSSSYKTSVQRRVPLVYPVPRRDTSHVMRSLGLMETQDTPGEGMMTGHAYENSPGGESSQCNRHNSVAAGDTANRSSSSSYNTSVQRRVPLVCPVPRRDTSHVMRSLGLNQPGWQETPGEVMMKGYEYENSSGGESSQCDRHNSAAAGDTTNRSSSSSYNTSVQRRVPLVCPVPRRDTSHAMRSLGLNQPGWQETPGEVMMKGYEYENSSGGESSQCNRHNSVAAGDTTNRSSSSSYNTSVQRRVPLVCPVPRRDTSHAMRSLGLNQPGWQETPGEGMMKGYEYENSPGEESSQYNRHNSVAAGDTANRSSSSSYNTSVQRRIPLVCPVPRRDTSHVMRSLGLMETQDTPGEGMMTGHAYENSPGEESSQCNRHNSVAAGDTANRSSSSSYNTSVQRQVPLVCPVPRCDASHVMRSLGLMETQESCGGLPLEQPDLEYDPSFSAGTVKPPIDLPLGFQFVGDAMNVPEAISLPGNLDSDITFARGRAAEVLSPITYNEIKGVDHLTDYSASNFSGAVDNVETTTSSVKPPFIMSTAGVFPTVETPILSSLSTTGSSDEDSPTGIVIVPPPTHRRGNTLDSALVVVPSSMDSGDIASSGSTAGGTSTINATAEAASSTESPVGVVSVMPVQTVAATHRGVSPSWWVFIPTYVPGTRLCATAHEAVEGFVVRGALAYLPGRAAASAVFAVSLRFALEASLRRPFTPSAASSRAVVVYTGNGRDATAASSLMSPRPSRSPRPERLASPPPLPVGIDAVQGIRLAHPLHAVVVAMGTVTRNFIGSVGRSVGMRLIPGLIPSVADSSPAPPRRDILMAVAGESSVCRARQQNSARFASNVADNTTPMERATRPARVSARISDSATAGKGAAPVQRSWFRRLNPTAVAVVAVAAVMIVRRRRR